MTLPGKRAWVGLSVTAGIFTEKLVQPAKSINTAAKITAGNLFKSFFPVFLFCEACGITAVI
jgi:hypothetical protein